MLNNYCFPDVKCPLGCWKFMDYCEEIPLHHYLHFKFGFETQQAIKNYPIAQEKTGHQQMCF